MIEPESLAELTPCPGCAKLEAEARQEGKLGFIRCAQCTMTNVHTFDIGPAANPHAVPADWYDGKPKPCPGSGKPSRPEYTGELIANTWPPGQAQPAHRVMRYACAWCDAEYPADEPMPEHTLVPVRPEDFVFKQGKFFYGLESEDGEIKPPGWPRPTYPIDRSHVTDSRAYLREVLGEWAPKEWAPKPKPDDDKEKPR